MGGAEHIGLQPDGFQFSVPLVEGLSQLLRLTVEGVQIVMSLLQNEGSRSIVLLRLLGSGGELFQGVQPHGHFHALQLVLQFQILFCLFRLDLQRLQLQLQLGDLVADAKQVVLGVLQFALRLLLAVAVLGNTGSLLKDFPAVAAFQGEDLVNAALADVGVALLAKTGVHKQLVDVPQTGGLLVDVVFAVAGAVIPAGDHDLVGIISQSTVRIVQGQGCFRESHGAPLLGAAEDHVLHFRAPQ